MCGYGVDVGEAVERVGECDAIEDEARRVVEGESAEGVADEDVSAFRRRDASAVVAAEPVRAHGVASDWERLVGREVEDVQTVVLRCEPYAVERVGGDVDDVLGRGVGPDG